MKDSEAKLRFIDLRVQGASYDTIAAELKKSKTTLVQWSRELEKEIENEEFIQYQSLLEHYKLTKKAKTEYLCDLVNRIREKLKNIDISKLSVKELITLLDKCEKDLNANLRGVMYHTGEVKKDLYESADDILNEETENLVHV